jgi:hypothetical protein
MFSFSLNYFLLGVFNYVRWRNGSGFFTAQMSNWRFFLLGYIFIQHDSAEVVKRKKTYFRKLSSLNMDDSSQDQDCSLKDIRIAVKSQGDDNTKLSPIKKPANYSFER